MNRALVKENYAEGAYPHVLCVCSAGILRSPTMAHCFSQEPFDFNTRSAGTEEYALIPVTYSLLQWAEHAIICAEEWQKWKIEDKLKLAGLTRDVFSLNIPDNYNFRDPALSKLIIDKGMDLFINTSPNYYF